MEAFDLDQALTMHRSWKMKFQLALGSVQSRDFDTQGIGDADACGLGRWLTANAGELERFPVVRELLPVHVEFHRQSQAIADEIRSGRIIHTEDPAIVAYLELSTGIEAMLKRLDADLRLGG
ncbi:MAG: CZB domain-containing protein [Sterolibacteriaceae bacterium]|uniref:CZB domain-containing protein n=1 Tax=Sulfuritalea sp. TaxID=2480090 RepID=UPI001A483E7A|nr:CZB domain-containing protein [Sulfuritalea sp.]MBL8479954.1 CZB domain-containing protein [Sterolibacteriaceae bacterium]MBN8477013.1 CZB domain-containing protein [Sulfuritalea sp.]